MPLGPRVIVVVMHKLTARRLKSQIIQKIRHLLTTSWTPLIWIKVRWLIKADVLKKGTAVKQSFFLHFHYNLNNFSIIYSPRNPIIKCRYAMSKIMQQSVLQLFFEGYWNTFQLNFVSEGTWGRQEVTLEDRALFPPELERLVIVLSSRVLKG